MKRKEKGIGIIGLSHWYWAYGCAYGIAANPAARLVAIADENEAKARKTAEVYGAGAWYRDYRELLENAEVDAVIITTTTNLHDQVAVDAAGAGKDILVGKPISRTLEGAGRIIEAAGRAGVKLMALGAGPGRGDATMKLIDEGAIGKPYTVHSSLWAIPPLCEPGVDEPGWFADPWKAAGGGFIDHAIYAVGKIRRYLGSEVISVYSEMGKFAYEDWDVEDHGMAVLRLRDGGIATIESTFTAPERTHSRTKIIGTEGEIEVEGGRITIWSRKEPYKNRHSLEMLPPNPVYDTMYAEIPVPTPPRAGGYKGTIDEFIQFLVDDREPLNTAEDAKVSLEVCLAAYESVRTSSVVDLPLKREVDVPAILAEL